MADYTKFQELLELLITIEEAKRHAGIAIIFDGNQFHWNVNLGGLRACELRLAKQQPPGYDLQSKG